MGLLSAAPEDAPVKSLPDNFIWPVEGPLAAHFHDALYLKFFGIPHQGIDIITHQLTPVKSAADGIVFLVKDGGLLGYTYVLIGHRDGIATLYGHLNVVQVAPGQEIHRGDVIGLSGGAPGTAGAGLITTGPHLHFEVIQNGINIDPLSVLP
jgi:murein DD-endopeptidase MepM/ murein hydrolase activator NlpD